MKTYIIDAYNIICKDKNLFDKCNKDRAIALAGLIELVAVHSDRYPSYQYRIIADGFIEHFASTPNPRIHLSFSHTKTADEKIKKMVAQSASKANLVVISSDTEVYNFAKIYGVEAVESEAFLKILNGARQISAQKMINTKTKEKSKNGIMRDKPGGMGRRDMQDFLQMFSEPLDE